MRIEQIPYMQPNMKHFIYTAVPTQTKKTTLSIAWCTKVGWSIDETRGPWAGENDPGNLRVRKFPSISTLHRVVQCTICQEKPPWVSQGCCESVAKSKAPQGKWWTHWVESTGRWGESWLHAKCPQQRSLSMNRRMPPGNCRSLALCTTYTIERSPNHGSGIHHNRSSADWGHSLNDPPWTSRDPGAQNAWPNRSGTGPKAHRVAVRVPTLFATPDWRKISTWQGTFGYFIQNPDASTNLVE